MMKFACRCELRDNPFLTYLVCILDLYVHVDLRSVPGPRARRERRPPVLWGPPFPGHSWYLLSVSVGSGRRVRLGSLVFEINIPRIPELMPKTNCWGVYPVPGLKRLLYTNTLSESLNSRLLISAQSVQSRKSENWNLPSYRSDLPHWTLSDLPARRRRWMSSVGSAVKKAFLGIPKPSPFSPYNQYSIATWLSISYRDLYLLPLTIPGYCIACVHTFEGK